MAIEYCFTHDMGYHFPAHAMYKDKNCLVTAHDATTEKLYLHLDPENPPEIVPVGNALPFAEERERLLDHIDELEERVTRNALQAVKFQNVLERIRDFAGGDYESAPIFRNWAEKVLLEEGHRPPPQTRYPYKGHDE